jgi:hypothetical protein
MLLTDHVPVMHNGRSKFAVSPDRTCSVSPTFIVIADRTAAEFEGFDTVADDSEPPAAQKKFSMPLLSFMLHDTPPFAQSHLRALRIAVPIKKLGSWLKCSACRRHNRCPFISNGDIGLSRSKGS